MTSKKIIYTAALAVAVLFFAGGGECEASGDENTRDGKTPDGIVSVALEFLTDSHLSPTEQKNILEGIKSFPNQREWVMSGNGSVYSIVLRQIQEDSRPEVRNKLEELAGNAAAMRTKYLMYLRAAQAERKKSYRNEESFAAALVAWDEGSGSGRLNLRNSISMFSGNWACAIAVAPDDSFGELTKRVAAMETAALNTAYCEALYPRARKLWDEKRYEDALVFYRELHSLKWMRPGVYLEAADCFAKTEKLYDAAKLVTETVRELGRDMDSGLLERAGDMLFEMGDENGAEQAYRLAAEKMRGEPL